MALQDSERGPVPVKLLGIFDDRFRLPAQKRPQRFQSVTEGC